MKNGAKSALEASYTAFERTVCCNNGNQIKQSNLSRFNGNKSNPVHNWFTYKEGFSSELLGWVCSVLKVNLDEIGTMLDPFCGVGTSLLSAQLSYQGHEGLIALGIERNPFIAFVARAKLNWRLYRVERIQKLIPSLITAVRQSPSRKVPLMDLITIRDQRVFNRQKLHTLLHAREIITAELDGTPELHFFQLGWAAIIEEVSNVRKDGRALRFVEKGDRAPVHQLLLQKWMSMSDDLKLLRSGPNDTCRKVETRVLEGDGRTLECIADEKRKFDLVLYSPPYLNNIDYTEVYKLELWLSGVISTQAAFRELRLRTLRSHPSIKFPETDFVDKLPSNGWPRRLRRDLIAVIPNDKDRTWRVRLVRAYMDDILLALRNQYRITRPGGHVVCVVGNSLHGRAENVIPVATDLLICALARSVGLKVERLQVSRQLSRRANDNHLLRESIIIMRRD